jgi:hypothetical protein
VFPSGFSTLRAPVFPGAFDRSTEFPFCGEKKGSPSLFYSILENGRTRRWLFGRYAVLVLAALCLAVAGMTATMAPRAAALSGRRMCMYVDGEYKSGTWRFVVDNYKKSGKCPYVDPFKHPDLITQHNPVPKRTCEEVSHFVGYGDDICRVLKEDELYELDFSQKSLTYTTTDEGPVKNFG